ncbi:MAG: glycolate oxidase iron-sulfur subunit [Clostridia bacterium]|nr:glycolate oxidase iron-sulfur subunit [Clostridia bacterium]
MKTFFQREEDIVRCNRCGFCEEVCPTFRATGEEFSLARGRNRLMRKCMEKEFDLFKEPEINHHIYSCLLCGACEVACPSSVITTTLVRAARAEITKQKGNPFPVRMGLHGVLGNQRTLSLGSKAIRFYQRSGARWLARHSGFLGLLGSLGKAEGILPDIPAKTLRDRLPSVLKKPQRTRHKVAYFAGCFMNNFFPDVAEATLRNLQHNDIEVVVPKSACCGVPHEAYGEVEMQKKLAKQNLDFFSKHQVEAIITDCASCAHGLHSYAELLEDDPKYGPIAAKFSKMVKDPSQYLVEVGFKKEMGPVNARVSYHDPCHAVRGIKVSAEPREILKSIPGLKFVEMNEANWCCGGAGSYNVTHYDLSQKILARKMGNFKATGAELLATSCPACLMQLGHGLDVHKIDAKAIHVMQLLDMAYQNKGARSKVG